MSATDELRRMLDERGVEYRFNDATKVFEWHFDGTDGEGSAHATEVEGGINIIACSLTPEQAIAATLGRGTCHITRQFTCSECEYQYPTRNYKCYETCDGRTAYASLGYDVLDCEKPNYCPNCGRKVVDA